MNHLKVLAVLGWTACLTCTGSATLWDLATDFSSTNNPNGPWQYGARLSGVFEIARRCDREISNFMIWVDSAGYPDYYASVGYNPNDYADCCILPHHVTLDSDLGAPMARWIAPTDGTYYIHVTMGGYMGPTAGGYGNWRVAGAHVDICGNDIPYSGYLDNGVENLKTWDLSAVGLHAGDTVDAWEAAATICGNTDTTMTIWTNAAPEPTTVVVATAGLLGLALRRRRR